MLLWNMGSNILILVFELFQDAIFFVLVGCWMETSERKWDTKVTVFVEA